MATQAIKAEPGPRLIDGDVINALASLTRLGTKGSITAQADGTQANAVQLVNGVNEVTTVAGANDSVQLPRAAAGSIVYVANAGANTLTVFGKNGSSDTINGTAGSTGVTQATTVDAIYACITDGRWRRVLSA